ncbi:conserved hypothetical protein (plasmid) [Rhodococcus jostii RHA1]|uniref:Uncharacterized protein n=1 Tax=Rhodococcus jostii (strain RHA1) TaxID=101510 RepID=Q0RVD4_RHOJR|nr:conserved hypothetical protein [Rhodococcus jostii RHA1]
MHRPGRIPPTEYDVKQYAAHRADQPFAHKQHCVHQTRDGSQSPVRGSSPRTQATPGRSGPRTGMAVPHREPPASPHNPANDLPEYGPPPLIGHGETLSPTHDYVRPGPTSDRGGRNAGQPYQQYQYVVE